MKKKEFRAIVSINDFKDKFNIEMEKNINKKVLKSFFVNPIIRNVHCILLEDMVLMESEES